MEAEAYLRAMLKKDTANGCKYDLEIGAIGHFFYSWQSDIVNAYKYRIADTHEIADALYVACSKYLLDVEFEVIDILKENDDLRFWALVKDLSQKIKPILTGRI